VHDRGENLRTQVRDCTIQYCSNGVNTNSSYAVFSGNNLLKSEGFECSGAGAIIAFNVIKDAYLSGISAGGNFTLNNVMPGTVVAFNTIDGATGAGISAPDSAHGMVISGNTIRKTTLQGIISNHSGANHLVGNNVIANNNLISCGATASGAASKIGIYVGGTAPVLITGNMVTDGGVAGYTTEVGCYISGLTSPGPAGTSVFGNKFRGTVADLKIEGSAATGIILGDNDIITFNISGSATTAQAITRTDQLHKNIQTLEHHLVTSNAAGNQTVTVGAAATSASRQGGADVAGKVLYQVPGGTTGVLFTVTFARAYAVAPYVFLQETNPGSALTNMYVDTTSTTGFSVSCATAQAAGSSFVYYWVVGV